MNSVVLMGQYLIRNSASRFLRRHGMEWEVFGATLRAEVVDRIENDFLFYMTGVPR